MKTLIGRQERILLISLVAFALFFRVATLMRIHTGVDERDYWSSAKAIAHGLPYPDVNHRTTRFSVILPVAVAQVVLGSHPDVYYVMPVLNAMVQAALAFLIGLRLRGKLTGFLAALALILFPYMIRAASQVRPEVFSLTYVLLAVYFFVEYMDRTEGEITPLLWTAAWLFIGYEAKITNLYFVPGLIVAIVVYKRKAAHAVLFCSILLGLFLAETALYAAFSPFKLGELEIILKYHIEGGSHPFVVSHFYDLFQRYSQRNLQAYWQIPFLLFAIAAVAYLVRRADKRIGTLIAAALSFFVGITFEVAGFHPLKPAETFINRYFTAVLVPVFLVLAYAAEGIVTRLKGRSAHETSNSTTAWYVGILGLGVAAVLVAFSLPGLPKGIRQYANSPLHPHRHPLVVNETYRREINRAYSDGTPIVAVEGIGGDNAIKTCTNYFLDSSQFVGGRPPLPKEVSRGQETFLVVERPGTGGLSKEVLAAVREPFRVERIPVTQLSDLSDNSFSGGFRLRPEAVNE